MTRALRFRPEARDQLTDVYQWYESRQRDLGRRFLEAAEACFTQILEHPESGAPFQRKTRRISVHDFPYYIVYVAAPDAIVVVAAIHEHSGPRRVVQLLP